MRRCSRKPYLATLLMLSWVACASEPEPEPEPPVLDTAAARDAIEEVREREIAAFTAGDADALAALFTSDAEVLAPDMAAVEGRDGVRAWAEDMSRQFTIGGGYTSAEIDVQGDWAVERFNGELELTPASGGETVTQEVKGLHVYERQADGSWQIRYDVWNLDPAQPNEE